MNPRFLEVLACPVEIGDLKEDIDSVVCTICHRVYPVDQGVIHFVKEEERPHNPKALARLEEFHSAALYERNAERQRQRYKEESKVREYVNTVAERGGVIVDLATGPGGGHIAPTLERLKPDGLLIATDACLPVIDFQYALFKSRYADQFEFIDTDLGKTLPFKDSSIDVFCGVAIINIHKVSATFQEVVRCMKPDGLAVISERFYTQESETAKSLANQGHLFASPESFQDYCEKIGLSICRFDEVLRRRGKTDPRDGLPLKETDEWTVAHIYLKRMET